MLPADQAAESTRTSTPHHADPRTPDPTPADGGASVEAGRAADAGDPAGSARGSASSGGPGSSGGAATRRGAVLVAGWLGVLATVLSVVFPFLPVTEHTATIVWPSPATGTTSVTAPLVALRPESMAASIPCAAVRSLAARQPTGATVLSTVPPASPDGARSGMSLSVASGQLRLVDRGQQVAAEPVPAGPCTVSLTSTGASTTIDLAAGPAQILPGDQRPQVVGIFSDLDAARDPVGGASVQVTPDTRFDTTPTALKVAVGVAAVLALIGCLIALARLDAVDGRRRWRPGSRPREGAWWQRLLRLGRPKGRDVVVAAVLLVWAAIGGQTSDDGYTLGIARNMAASGYVGNYYRWFDVPEAPFGWFYDFYAQWIRVSDSLLWLRLPSVAMGLVAWWLVSRGLLPRLGPRVRLSRAAGWAAATVFLAFWMAYDSGLRPEPVVVVCTLVAWVSVERAVALGRWLPLALGLLAATLAIGANPAGVIAVVPFLVAVRPLWALVRRRIRAQGVQAALAPLAAAGTLILVVAWADQTWAAIIEANRVRAQIGPNWPWYTELTTRYAPLLAPVADGSVARRFPVLLLGLCLIVCPAVLLRRGRIPGAALGPANRLIAGTVLSILIFALTPTKWTHHFGDLVGLGACLAALAACTTGADGLRSVRNRLIFLGGVLVALAVAFAGPNTWWYTNNWGVPWNDMAPVLDGWPVSTLLLGVAVVVWALAGIEHLRGLREHRHPDHPDAVDRVVRAVAARIPVIGPRWLRGRDRLEPPSARGRRALRAASAPVAVLCGLVVLFNLASMGKAIEKQSGSWSMGADALTHLTGGSCGLSSRVFAERAPVDGVLAPAPAPTGMAPPTRAGVLPIVASPTLSPGTPGTPSVPGGPPASGAAPALGAPSAPGVLPPGTVAPDSPAAALVDPRPTAVGFRPDGVPPTGGGTGVSGFEYTLTGGLGGPSAPAYGSFDPSAQTTNVLRTPWVQLTPGQRSGSTPLVATVAGRLNDGITLTVQYANRLPDGGVQVVDAGTLNDGRHDEAPWRELRLDLARTPAASATEVRLVATDAALGPQGWVAVAPLRAPQLAPLSQVVGSTPMFLEYPVGLASPCLQPFASSGGIAQAPAYRLRADASRMRADGENWSSAQAGGPLGWIDILDRREEIPTYLDGAPSFDWGRLEALEPYDPTAVAPTVVRADRTVSGTATSGQLGDPPPGIPSPER